MTADSRALVLFSGGQDSTTCLAWALNRFERVETIGFDYHQRHRVELTCREPVRAALAHRFPEWQARLGVDHVLDVGMLKEISATALTSDAPITQAPTGLPTTFVPGRNLIFLTLAAAVAYRRELTILVGGMCETDFSGYPDCRDSTVKSMQVSLSLGMDRSFRIETPLMWLDKKAIWQIAEDLGGEELVEIVRVKTHTCYLGDRSQLASWGYGCGGCPACELRANGYARWRQGHS